MFPHQSRCTRLAPSLPLFALLSLLVLSAFVVACGGDGDDDEGSGEAAEVRATFGTVVLALDLGGATLPGGLSAADITATAVAEAPGPSAGATHLGSFELGPDGASFAEPLSLAIERPGPPGGTVTAIHLAADGSSQLLPFVAEYYDTERDVTRYGAEIAHFSEVHVYEYPGAGQTVTLLETVPEETYLVGESFTARIRVQINRLSYDWRTEGLPKWHMSSIPAREWRHRASWGSDGGSPPTLAGALDLYDDDDPLPSPLAPKRVPAQGSSEVVVSADRSAVVLEQTFTCEDVGRYYIWFRSKVNRAMLGQIVTGNQITHREETTREFVAWFGITGECLASATPPTETLTPTPTPTAPTGGGSSGSADGETGGTITIPSGDPDVPGVVVPAAAPIGTPVAAGPGFDPPDTAVLVFGLDGVWFDASGLSSVPAHPPFCSYEHVHGGAITSIVPVDGQTVRRTEHLGECGYGPPAFYWIEDPR